MSRVNLIDLSNATGDTKGTLDQVNTAFGIVPNMFKAVANSPAALGMMWSAFGALGSGTLGAKLGEQIAVAVADRNGCEYCLSAHTALGRSAGSTVAEMAAAQEARSDDPRTAAILGFAVTLVEERGNIADADFATLRTFSVSDAEIVEIIAHVALNLFTNYLNVALDVPVDFESVKFRKAG